MYLRSTVHRRRRERVLRWVGIGWIVALTYIPATLWAMTGLPDDPVPVDIGPPLRAMERKWLEAAGWDGRYVVLSKPVARPTVGSKRSFWTFKWSATPSTEDFYQVPATCRAVGEHAYVFVEDVQWDRGRVEQKDVDRMVAVFDRSTPADPNRGIYQTDTEAFGPPPDVDRDPNIYILLLDIVDQFSSKGAYVGGYFSSVNEVPDYVARRAGMHSNEIEMLYVDVNPGDPSSPRTCSTVAHEFQHMIHFNQDEDEEDWINEGCSTFAEFLNGYGVRVPENFHLHPEDSLVDWGNTLEDYEQVGMFIQYLFEHWGGLETISTLVSEKANGIYGVTQTLVKRGYRVHFDDVFRDWVVANYLDDPRVGDGRYSYAHYDLSGLYRFKNTRSYEALPVEGTRGAIRYSATNYLAFRDGGHLWVDFNGSNADLFDLQVIQRQAGHIPQVERMSLDRMNDGAFSFADIDEVILIPTVIPADLAHRDPRSMYPYEYAAHTFYPSETGIVSVLPTPGASNVQLNAEVIVVFAEPYDPSSLEVIPDGYPLDEVVQSEDGRRLTLLPAKSLQPDREYTLIIRAGVRDRDGNILLSEDYTWSFRTTRKEEAANLAYLAYDEGTYNYVLYWENEGEGSGVRFTPPYHPAQVLSAQFYLADLSLGNRFVVRVFEDNGAGLPGRALTPPIPVEATHTGWFDVDLASQHLQVEGDFHVMFQVERVQQGGISFVPQPRFGAENLPPVSGRSWDKVSEGADRFRYDRITTFDYAIRAVVAPGTTVVTATGSERIPSRFLLAQNTPNPFNARTTIRYEVPILTPVRIVVYNLLGQPIRTLVDGVQEPGSHVVQWDGKDHHGRDVASGVYFYHLSAENGWITQVKRMILVR